MTRDKRTSVTVVVTILIIGLGALMFIFSDDEVKPQQASTADTPSQTPPITPHQADGVHAN